MIKMIKYWILGSLLVLLNGCGEKFDDTSLKEQIIDLEYRLGRLEEQCKLMNTNIASLQTLVQALESRDYITGVAPVMKDGKEVGYTLTFSLNGPITVYHGADGEDGYTPMVGVAKGADGLYYWTLDGDWLLDGQGNPLKVTGTDGDGGENGEDGITPRLKVEEGFWYVSYDEGATWVKSGSAVTSSDGLFTDVQVTEDWIVFMLADGNSLTFPRYRPVEISLDVKEQGIASGATVRIPYTLTGATENTVVTASSDGNYRVRMEEQTTEGGFVTITAPDPYVDGYVNVLVSDGAGHTWLRVINFYEWVMSVSGADGSNSMTYSMPIKGGTVEIPLSVNFDYEVRLSEDAKEWIEVEVESRASQRNELLRLNVASNKTDSARNCDVAVVPVHSILPLFKVHIQQGYQVRYEDGSANSNLSGLTSGYQD